MKVKQMLYPKTQRMTSKDMVWQVTEKLDGSNLTLFKLNCQLYFGTRNWVFNFDEDVKIRKSKIYLFVNGIARIVMNITIEIGMRQRISKAKD